MSVVTSRQHLSFYSGWGGCPSAQCKCCHPEKSDPVGHLPQGWPSPSRGWREQREEDWRYLLLGRWLPEGWPGHSLRTHFGSKLFGYQGLFVSKSFNPAFNSHPSCRVSWTSPARQWPTWSREKLPRRSARRSTSRTTSLPVKKNRSERRTNGARRSEMHQSQLCHCWFHAWSHSLINNKRFDYFLCQICF